MTKMKEWPKGNKPADFEDITAPLARAFRFAYSMTRKNEDKDIPWNGYERGGLHCALGARQSLSASNLRYSKEEQGRDALTELLGLAVALGIEQGRRIEVSDSGNKARELTLRMIKSLATGPTDDPAKMLALVAKLLGNVVEDEENIDAEA